MIALLLLIMVVALVYSPVSGRAYFDACLDVAALLALGALLAWLWRALRGWWWRRRHGWPR